MKTRILMMTLAVLGWCVCAQAGLTYDAAADFSATANPNGAWSYLYAPVDWPGIPGSAYYGHTAPLPGYDLSFGVIGWCVGDSGGWTDPNVSKNTTNNTLDAYGITWGPQVLGFGGSWAETSGILWTCQKDGVYDINATFTGIQSNYATSWIVSKNFSFDWLFWHDSDGTKWNTSTYSAQLSLVAGDTLDFVVYGVQATGLDARISEVPEPGTLTLLGFGLVGLLVSAWRKRV
jgi:hypothetical protein